MKTTPTPLEVPLQCCVDGIHSSNGFTCYIQRRHINGNCPAQSVAIQKQIVRAVNCHDELVAALNKAFYCLSFENEEIVTAEDKHRAWSAIQSALAKAKA